MATPTFADQKEALKRELSTRYSGKLAELRSANDAKDSTLASMERHLLSMAEKLPRVMGPVTVAATVAGSAFAAGYAQEYLDENQWGKVGPVDAVATLGLGVAGAAAFALDDPDFQLGGVAVGAGAIAASAANAGRKARVQHREAMAKLRAASEKNKAA